MSILTVFDSFMHLAPTAFSSYCNTGWRHVWLIKYTIRLRWTSLYFGIWGCVIWQKLEAASWTTQNSYHPGDYW